MNSRYKSIIMCLLATIVLQAGMFGYGIACLIDFDETIRKSGMHPSYAALGRLVTHNGLVAKPFFCVGAERGALKEWTVAGTWFRSAAADILCTRLMSTSWVCEMSRYMPLHPPRWSEGPERFGPDVALYHQVVETAIGWPFRYYFSRWESEDNAVSGVAKEVPRPVRSVSWWRALASIATTFGLTFVLMQLPMMGRLARRAARKRRGVCPGCGYQVNKEQLTCPECGECKTHPEAGSMAGGNLKNASDSNA